MANTDTFKCGTCGNHIRENEPQIAIANKHRPNIVQHFHADYTGCSEAEQRQGAAYARKHGDARRKQSMSNINIGLEGERG